MTAIADDLRAGGRHSRLRLQTVLPVQFHAAPAAGPETRLMFAVLEDAVGIFRKYARASGRKRRRLVVETEEWLFSDDISWPFSFVNVCHTLDIDVAWLRRRLRPPAPPTVAVETRPLAAGAA